MKLRKSSAIPASSFFPCCFSCLLRSCQLSLHVSINNNFKLKDKEIAAGWEGVVSVTGKVTFDLCFHF